MSKKRSQSARSRRRATPAPVARPSVRASRVKLIAAGAVGVVVVALAAVALSTRAKSPPPAHVEPPLPSFVGASTCASCHATESAQWSRSQHGAAMAAAIERTVLGDFADARVEYAGTTTRFFRRDGKYFVRTDGADGRVADFEVRTPPQS